MIRSFAGFLFLLVLAACSTPGPVTQISLMEPPALYRDSALNPFPATLPVDRDIPYATQRVPSDRPGESYGDAPNNILRVGHAQVSIGTKANPEAGSVSTRSRAAREAPLFVTVDTIEEQGPLTATRHVAVDPRVFPSDAAAVDTAYAARLNRQLAAAPGNDLVIYVHGVRSDFENPILAASELQHFSGYRNVFAAYSWPASQRLLTYFQDTEDSIASSFLFRRYVRFLANQTNAERIHIVAHSAGTRVVMDAIGQFALQYSRASDATIQSELNLGHVILIGSDADPRRIGGYLIDGADRVVDGLTIYTSSTDRALNLSNLVFGGRERLGQTIVGPVPVYAQQFLAEFEKLDIIDVSAAEQSNSANGHGYLRGSPWVSSDILTIVNFDLSPAERGLVPDADGLGWVFPKSYPERLQSAIRQRNPELVQ